MDQSNQIFLKLDCLERKTEAQRNSEKKEELTFTRNSTEEKEVEVKPSQAVISGWSCFDQYLCWSLVEQ